MTTRECVCPFPFLTIHQLHFLFAKPSGKILLCNGCGIRWRRTKGKEEGKRIRPGPKRAHQSAGPPDAAELHKQSVILSIKKSCASSSSSILSSPPRKTVDGFPRSHDKTGRTERCPKMDLKNLLCASISQMSPKGAKSGESTVFSGRTNVHLSQIRIDNLINYCDESKAGARSSAT